MCTSLVKSTYRGWRLAALAVLLLALTPLAAQDAAKSQDAVQSLDQGNADLITVKK